MLSQKSSNEGVHIFNQMMHRKMMAALFFTITMQSKGKQNAFYSQIKPSSSFTSEKQLCTPEVHMKREAG